MAPKLGIKRLLVKKPATKAPSAIKGLAGFRKASFVFSGAVDKGVAQQNAALASRVAVVDGFDARLLYVHLPTNSDRYYILQGLEDPLVPASKPLRYYAYQRWGRTGTGGVCRLQGPMGEQMMKDQLKKVFHSKTAAEWGALTPGQKTEPGKYWLVNSSDPDESAQWYYASDSPSGEWCPYDAGTAKQVEELYAEHHANRNKHRSLASRLVSTGSFAYRINLDTMMQQNTITGKERQICRGKPTPSQTSNPAYVTSPIATSAKKASSPKTGLSRTASVEHMSVLVSTGGISKETVPALKSWLSKHDITATGSKMDLVARVKAVVW